jgi:hypothetical protein
LFHCLSANLLTGTNFPTPLGEKKFTNFEEVLIFNFKRLVHKYLKAFLLFVCFSLGLVWFGGCCCYPPLPPPSLLQKLLQKLSSWSNFRGLDGTCQ